MRFTKSYIANVGVSSLQRATIIYSFIVNTTNAKPLSNSKTYIYLLQVSGESVAEQCLMV